MSDLCHFSQVPGDLIVFLVFHYVSLSKFCKFSSISEIFYFIRVLRELRLSVGNYVFSVKLEFLYSWNKEHL